MTLARSALSLSPLKVTVGYVAFGVVWIPVTDYLVTSAVDSTAFSTQLQTIKGWVFVALSALLIYALSSVHRHQMRRSREKLQTANQQLQVLNRVFRHNIRNDLNVVMGYIEMVAEEIRGVEARTQENLQTARETAAEIVTVSDKLRVVERVDPTSEPDDTVDLVSLVEREVRRVEQRYPDASITLDTPAQASVPGDDSLAYVARELVENAVEHHDHPASCEIRVSIEHTDGEITVSVEDNGPGIPEDELTALRSTEETQLAHASSVGLWLVTWLCRLHGGSIRFECEAERGTTVRCRLQSEPQRSSFGRFASNPSTPA